MWPQTASDQGVARIELDGAAREFVGELLVDADVGAVALADAQVVPPGEVGMRLAVRRWIAIARWNISPAISRSRRLRLYWTESPRRTQS